MKPFLSRWTPGVSVILFGLAVTVQAATPELRYQFKAGSNHVYSLHLEANEPRYISTLDGTVTFQVKSAHADGITLTAKGALHNAQKAKDGMARMRPPMGPGMGGMLRVGGFRFGAPRIAQG